MSTPSRFSGPPPCSKFHCEFVFKQAQQVEAELQASKQHSVELNARLEQTARATVDLRRKNQDTATQLKHTADHAAKLQHAIAGIQRERDQARAALAQRQLQLGNVMARMKQLEKEVQDTRRVESPRSLNRARDLASVQAELNRTRRIIVQVKDSHERTRSMLKRAGHLVSATLGRVKVAREAGDGSSADSTLILQQLTQLDEYVQQTLHQQDRERVTEKQLEEAQAALQQANEEAATAVAEAKVSAARQEELQASLHGLKGQLDSIRVEVNEAESNRARKEHGREADHRLAMAEKRALQAEVAVESLQRGLKAKALEVEEWKQRTHDTEEKAASAHRRVEKLQQVFETVMAVREEERVGAASASDVRARQAAATATRLKAQLQQAQHELKLAQDRCVVGQWMWGWCGRSR